MKRYAIANWKSHKSAAAVTPWFADLTIPASTESLEIVIAPPFTLLPRLLEEVTKNNLPISLAAQDVSPYPLGAYTGEVAAQQLADLGVVYCIVGHSERRKYFHETDQDVAKKIAELLHFSITPVLCLDEAYITSQAKMLTKEQREAVLVAYEPITAIGSGHPVSVDTVKKVVTTIHEHFPNVPVLYGGSVDAKNVSEYLLATQGVLVGTDSLAGKDFSGILAHCAND